MSLLENVSFEYYYKDIDAIVAAVIDAGGTVEKELEELVDYNFEDVTDISVLNIIHGSHFRCGDATLWEDEATPLGKLRAQALHTLKGDLVRFAKQRNA